MVRFDCSDGSQSDFVVGHPRVFPAGRGVLRRIERRDGSASREARGALRGSAWYGRGLAALGLAAPGLSPGARVSEWALDKLLRGLVPGTKTLGL